MTPRPPSWQAPVVFRTHRGADQYAVEYNPFLPGSEASDDWLCLYWHDQADRGLVRAARTAKIAIVCTSIAVVISIVRLIW